MHSVKLQNLITKFKFKLAEKLEVELNADLIDIPLFVKKGTGGQDDLCGTVSPVSFSSYNSQNTTDNTTNNPIEHEILQSSAKYKRHYIHKHNLPLRTGVIFTMCGIRPHEIEDATHSMHVSQYDWEVRITEEEKTIETLHNYANKVYSSILSFVPKEKSFPEKLFCISAENLQKMFPDISNPSEREDLIVKIHKAVFVTEIGHPLNNSLQPHSQRAPDYDDWNLNGDILVEFNSKALELSSMGIRVDEKALNSQLKIANQENRKNLKWHKNINSYCSTIGGGIGRERCAMFVYGINEISNTIADIEI